METIQDYPMCISKSDTSKRSFKCHRAKCIASSDIPKNNRALVKLKCSATPRQKIETDLDTATRPKLDCRRSSELFICCYFFRDKSQKMLVPLRYHSVHTGSEPQEMGILLLQYAESV